LKSSFYYYSYLRENVLNSKSIRIPISLAKYYESFLEQAVSISLLATEATSEVEESVHWKMHNKSLKHRHFVAGQFLSRAFVVLLRKSIPQKRDLKTAA